MRESIPPGKIPPDLLARLFQTLPSPPPEVSLGPRVGEDACVLEVPKGSLVVATDPITLTGRDLGPLSVIVNANDVAVTGARPRWFLVVILVPPGTAEAALEDLFAAIIRELTRVGAHLVGGHTEVTDAVTRPVVMGQMLGLVETGRFVPTGGVRPGDAVVQVGPVPIEGAAVLAREAADRLEGLQREVVAAARDALERPGISVVEPALLAAELGTTSLHDPTEGGLASGLHELAAASSVSITVDQDAVLLFEPGVEVCEALGADPWATLASGCLLAAFPHDLVDAAMQQLLARDHRAALIGMAEPGSGVRQRAGGPIPWPTRDEVARILSWHDPGR